VTDADIKPTTGIAMPPKKEKKDEKKEEPE
jgi:hypothetical protein